MKNLFFCLVFLLFAFSATAQQDSLLLESDTLGQIVVTAQRKERLLKDTPASLVLRTAEDFLSRQDRSTPEALMALPGIFVQKTNQGGGSPFLRGLTGNQTLLLIDGIRLNNATFRYGPNQYLNTVDPFSLERMEVWKGGGSVPYGSDALGGTVHLLSWDPEFRVQGVMLRGEALGQVRSGGMEQTVHIQGGFSAPKAALHLGGTFRNFGDLVGGDTTGVQSPSGYPEGAFDLKAKIKLGQANVLTIAHQFFRQEEVPVFHKIQLENFSRNHTSLQQRSLGYLRLERYPIGSLIEKITATASLQRSDEKRESRKNGSTVLRREADQVSSIGVSLQAEALPARHWNMTAGMEYYYDLVRSERFDREELTGISEEKRGLYPDGSVFSSAAIFFINSLDLGRWSLSGGARFNRFFIKVTDETIGETRISPDAFVYDISLLRRLSDRDNLFAGFRTGFRAPNIDDLGSLGIVDFRYEVPATGLRPEKSAQAELGYRRVSGRLKAEGFLFWNELRDLITRVRVDNDSISGYPVYRKENIQEGFIWGVESNASWQISNPLSLQAAVSWQYGQSRTDEEPLRRIPPVFGRMGIQYTRLHWSIWAEGMAAGLQDRLAAGDKSDNRIPEGGTPGWWVLNVYGQYSWRLITIRAGAWNLFDKDYRYHGSGVNGPGRSASISAKLAF